MHLLDWILIALPVLLVAGIAIYTQRYMNSVAEFMSAGRVAGPYLLAVASGELQAGAVVFVANFEMIARSGFTLAWWGWLSFPVWIILAISGFVTYRFRQTRAMTLGQFFELRYSKSFRVFTGLLAFLAGIINFGIIPAIGARCMVYFLGLPASLTVFSHHVPTYIPLMALFLSVSLIMTLCGGLITVMVTDCMEGIITQIAYLIIIVALLSMFGWAEISHVLESRPPGQSLVNPFDSRGIQDFNLWYVLMSICVGVYGTRAWQNASGYNSAAISPHASVMGGILARWRELGKTAVIALLAICAVTYLQHPDFAAGAAQVQQEVHRIDSPQIQQQMEVPIAISHFLPAGIRGVFCAILIMGIFGGDATHLHSWSGIFVQDVLVALRKNPFSPKRHILVLRLAIIGVAVFAFLFGSLFQQTQYIVMWWSITTAVFVGGAGAAIIGGLYWKKGTAAGAWVAMLAGSCLAGGGIVGGEIYHRVYGSPFPFNGVEVFFFSSLIAIALYVLVSLLTCREDFDMDRLLHRGKYAAPDAPADGRIELSPRTKYSWGRLLGIDENFTRGDRWIAGSLFGWGMLWFTLFLVGTVWNLVAPWPVSAWTAYWHVAGIGVPIFISFVTAIWFTWGGLRDIRRLFGRLRLQEINPLDDGTVIGHQNLNELRPGNGRDAVEDKL